MVGRIYQVEEKLEQGRVLKSALAIKVVHDPSPIGLTDSRQGMSRIEASPWAKTVPCKVDKTVCFRSIQPALEVFDAFSFFFRSTSKLVSKISIATVVN